MCAISNENHCARGQTGKFGCAAKRVTKDKRKMRSTSFFHTKLGLNTSFLQRLKSFKIHFGFENKMASFHYCSLFDSPCMYTYYNDKE